MNLKRLGLILFILFSPLLLSAQRSKTQTQDKLSSVRKEIEALNAQIKATDARSSDALSRLTLTRKKISASKKLAGAIQEQVDSINSAIAIMQGDIDSESENLQRMEDAYEKVVRSAYLLRNRKMSLLLVLSGDNLSQMFRRAVYLRVLSQEIRTRANEINARKRDLSLSIEELEELKRESTALLSQRNTELSSLKAAERREQNEITSLKKNRKRYEKQLATKKKEAERLNKTLKDLIAKENKSKKSPASKSDHKSRQTDTRLNAAFAASKGKLPYPVEGTVVESFGEHWHPVYTKVKLPFNNGCNIATAADAPVHAVYEGEVRNVVLIPGYNQCVLIAHGDYYTFYCKLKDVRVKAGDRVRQGDILGLVDSIAGDTQLHFQLWQESDPQDPELWLKR